MVHVTAVTRLRFGHHTGGNKAARVASFGVGLHSPAANGSCTDDPNPPPGLNQDRMRSGLKALVSECANLRDLADVRDRSDTEKPLIPPDAVPA